jgi:tRNA/tmRNA/rRNA uracil-C5-methylase (TrmA/RlmC/RlmD family)
MEIEVTVTGLGYGGEAVGRLPDGRAVFVPYALPGERVRVRVEEEKRGYARAACGVIDASPADCRAAFGSVAAATTSMPYASNGSKTEILRTRPNASVG